MKAYSDKIIDCLLTAAASVLLFLVLQGQFRFLFLGMGDGQVFLWDTDAWRNELGRPGGFSYWLNSFIVQFFHVPVLGTVLASMILALTALESSLIIRGIMHKPLCGWLCFSPLFLLPTAFLCLDVVTDSYSFQAVTDYLWVAGLLLVCIRCGYGLKGKVAICLSVLIILTLTGPFLRTGSISGSHHFILAAWGSLAVLPAGALVPGSSRGPRGGRQVFRIIVFVMASAAVSLSFVFLMQKHRQPRQEQLSQLSFYARNGQWRYLTAACRQMDMNNYMLLNYANLALSYEGRLLEHWTDYQQVSPKGLCMEADLTPGCMSLLSMIYWRVGNVAGALDMAFEANQWEETPFLLEMLIKANIVFGSYKVAEKYIARLAKTLCFRNRANDLRQLLSDEAVAADAELAAKREGLPHTGAFTVRDRMIDDLILLIEADSSNTAARDYAIVYLILSRDAASLKMFVDKFYGTDILPLLSVDMQIGLLTVTDGDYDYCSTHGVDAGVIDVYKRQKGGKK